MTDTMAPVKNSLEELKALVAQTSDAQERKGLEAFIECVAPQLVDGAVMTYLGKIASIVQTDGALSEFKTSAEAFEALREHFDVELEPAGR